MDDDIIELNRYADTAIELEHGPDTLKIAKELSDFVATLNISHKDNDKLVYLMRDQLLAAEHEQFLAGFDLGLKIAKTAISGE